MIYEAGKIGIAATVGFLINQSGWGVTDWEAWASIAAYMAFSEMRATGEAKA